MSQVKQDGFEDRLIAYQRAQRRSSPGLKLSPQEVSILRYVATHNEAREKELQVAKSYGPASLSRAISRLVDRKLLKREVAPEDARRHVLRLTEKGSSALSKWDETFATPPLGQPARPSRRRRETVECPGQTTLLDEFEKMNHR